MSATCQITQLKLVYGFIQQLQQSLLQRRQPMLNVQWLGRFAPAALSQIQSERSFVQQSAVAVRPLVPHGPVLGCGPEVGDPCSDGQQSEPPTGEEEGSITW